MAEENTQVEEQSDEDVFAQAFGEAVAAADGAVSKEEPKKEEPKSEPADAPKDGEGDAKGSEKSEASGEEQPGKASAEAKEPDDQGGAPDASESKPADGDASSGPKDGNAELIEAIKALAPKPPEKPAEEPKQEAKAPAAPEPFKYTAEEQKILDDYNKEWDEHARAADLREKRLTHEITSRMQQALDVVLQQIEQGLAPFVQGHVQLAQERHITSVKQAHPDYAELQPELGAWIEKQPKYLRAALQETYDKGSTEDVIELYTNFKRDTGRTQPKSSGTPPTKPEAKKDEVPADKVAEMAPVSSKRSTPAPSSSGPDQNDYDAAFAEALRELAA